MRLRSSSTWVVLACALAAPACSSSSAGAPDDAGITFIPFDGGGALDAGSDAPVTGDADEDAAAASRFVTRVVSTSYGECAGFGIPGMPQVVEGPPVGGGDMMGGLDVVSLGNAGTIVLSFEPNAIVDGPGPDFIVFENPFFYGSKDDAGNQPIQAEPGIVSVSDDGVTWKTWPCTATQDAHPDGYGQCAGWHPVYSNPMNGISPLDPSVSGGDSFDLADLGVTHARYVRIIDHANETCRGLTTNGFDLDAIGIVNAELR